MDNILDMMFLCTYLFHNNNTLYILLAMYANTDSLNNTSLNYYEHVFLWRFNF